MFDFNTLLEKFGNKINIFNQKPNKQVQKNAESILNNQTALNTIASQIYFDIERYNAWQSSYWDPNPIHRNSKFRGIQEFYQMGLDPKILNCFNQRDDTLVNKDWSSRPAVENDENEIVKAEFCKQNYLKIRNLNRKKKAIMSDKKYGYSITEIVWDYQDMEFTINLRISSKKRESRKVTIPNALVIRDLNSLVPSAFTFDGKRQMYFAPNGFVKPRLITDAEKANLIISTFEDIFGSPYGWPLTAALFPYYIMKKAILAWRLVYLEKFGVPTVEGEYPAEIADPDHHEGVQNFIKHVGGLMHSASIVHPVGYAVKLIQDMTKAGTMDVFQNGINYIDQGYSELILGHKQATEATSIGSLASSKVKEAALRQDILETDGMALDTVLAEQCSERLIRNNFPDNGLFPDHRTHVQQEESQKEQRLKFKDLNEMGVDLSLTQIMRDLNLDPPLDKEDILKGKEVTVTQFNQQLTKQMRGMKRAIRSRRLKAQLARKNRPRLQV